MTYQHPTTKQFIRKAQYNKLTQQRGETNPPAPTNEDSESDESSRHQHFETVSATSQRTSDSEEQDEDREQAASYNEVEDGEQAITDNEDGEQAALYNKDKDREQAVTDNEGSDNKPMSISTERANNDREQPDKASNSSGGNMKLTTFTFCKPEDTKSSKILKFEIEKVSKVNFSYWTHCLSNHMELMNCLEIIEFTKQHAHIPRAINKILANKDWRKQN